jgi:cyanophycin synthetase
MLSGNKLMTYTLAEELGLPTVELEVYKGKEQVLDFWNRFDGKCILKTVRGQGGSGVYMYFQGPEDYIAQAEKLSTEGTLLLQAWSSSSVDVRLLLIGGKYTAATIREPFFLEGDGISQVGDLIEKENSQRMMFNEQHHSSMAKTFLSLASIKRRTGLGGNHVLKLGERLQCTLANISSGGVARDVTDTIHPDFIKQSTKLSEALDCPVLAVDFLCKDPTLGFEDGSTGTLFLETNTSPGIDLHQFPHVGLGRNVASTYIDYLLDFCGR